MWCVVALALAQSFSNPALISADPDAPIAELGWQTSLVAKIGVPLTLLEAGKGPWFVVGLPSFIELRNRSGSTDWVPYQYWRARVQLVGHLVFALSDGLSLSAGLRFEHESDHPTQGASTSDRGFVNLNAIALISTLQAQAGRNALAATLTGKLHVLTCTTAATYCAQGGGAWGDRSLEAALALTYQRVLYASDDIAFDGFASVFGQVLIPTQLIALERRFTAKLGVGATRPRLGRLFLFANLWVGSPPGYLRNGADTAQVGFGFGWTPS